MSDEQEKVESRHSFDVTDALIVVGLISLLYGIGKYSPPAAFIAFGVAAVAAGFRAKMLVRRIKS